MSALILGNGLGLFNSSFSLLGNSFGQARLGQAGESSYVNAFNGNLVLQRRDQLLVGLGIDANLTRTYNSQGQLDGDNNDGWRVGLSRLKSVQGVANTEGSSIARVNADGSETTYLYDSSTGKYRSTDGTGAHDTIVLSLDGTATWYRDDNSAMRELYAADGYLLEQHDKDSNKTWFSYVTDSDGRKLLSKVTNSNQEMQLDYDLQSKQLNSVKINTFDDLGNSINLQHVSYGYDTNGRLDRVTVDLTPEDTTDSEIYETTYTYEGSTNLVRTISQSDGTQISFSYEFANGQYRVKTVTDGLNNVTTYTYDQTDTFGNYTSVTDAQGHTSRFYYNGSGYLTRSESTAIDGRNYGADYTYDADNNLSSVTHYGRYSGQSTFISSDTTSYEYDANGNVILERDALGNTITRTYTANNQLETETLYVNPDPDGEGAAQASEPLTSRYVYDLEGHVRFVINSAGEVTERLYNAVGTLAKEYTYSNNTFNISGLANDEAPQLSALESWSAGLDKSRAILTTYEYDFRGQLKSSSTYDEVSIQGDGVGVASKTDYIYDYRGKLLQSISANGTATADLTDYITQYSYDGLGRLLSVTDAEGNISSTTYHPGGQIVTSSPNGLLKTSQYDAAGRLISTIATDANDASKQFGNTYNHYDSRGQLIATRNQEGSISYNFYDNLGRVTHTVDATGAVKSYEYDKRGNVLKTTAYANRVNTTGWFDPVTNTYSVAERFDTTTLTLDPSKDRVTENVYDSANRLTSSFGPEGTETKRFYDGLNRVIRTEVVGIDGIRTTRTFYDASGRVEGALDAEGYLVHNTYDAAGRLTKTVAYAKQTSEGLRLSGSFSELLASASEDAAENLNNIVTRNIYDNQSRVIGSINAEGYLTETVYNLEGQVEQTIRYATKVDDLHLDSNDLADLRPVVDSKDQTSTFTYNELGLLISSTDYQGVTTTYRYDAEGQLIETNRGTSDVRRSYSQYDAAGRTTGTVSGIGADQLGSNASELDITSKLSTHGSQFIYDTAGRLTQRIDANGNATTYFYDVKGRERFIIDAEGGVKETQYNAFGDITKSISYANTLSATQLSGLQGGLVNESSIQSFVQDIADSSYDTVTEFTYNRRGEVLEAMRQVLNSTGNISHYKTTNTYNTWGELKTLAQGIDNDSVINGKTLTTEYIYDDRGLVTRVIKDSDGLAQTTNKEYDAFGRVIKVWDANNNLSQIEYDRLGRTVVTTDPTNASSITTYDAFDRVLTQTDALGNKVRYEYNDSEKSVTTYFEEGVTTKSVTNEHGETVTTYDSKGNFKQFIYDKNGQLTSTIDELGNENRNEYDNAGRLIDTFDAKGNRTHFEYDAVNRVISKTIDPDGLNLTTSFAYDGKGQVLTSTDAKGVITTTEYDKLGQVKQVTVDPAGLNLITRYEYDGQGNQLTVTQAPGRAEEKITSYHYDALGRLETKVKDPNGLNIVESYTYDNNNNLIQSTNANGDITRFAYDKNNQLRFTLDSQGYLTENVYNLNGQLIETKRYDKAFNISGEITVDAIETALSSWYITEDFTNVSSGEFNTSVFDHASGAIQLVDGRVALTRTDHTVKTWPSLVTTNRVDMDSSINLSYELTTTDPSQAYALTGLHNLGSWGGGNLFRHSIYIGSGSINATVVEHSKTTESVSLATAKSNTTYVVEFEVKDGISTAYVYEKGTSRDSAFTHTLDVSGDLWADTRFQAYAYAGPGVTGTTTYLDNLEFTETQTSLSTSYIYDDLGRQKFSIDPNGYVTEKVYDSNNNVIQINKFEEKVTSRDQSGIDSLDRTKVITQYFSYDEANRQVFSIDANGSLTKYEYDENGQVIASHKYSNFTVTDLFAGSALDVATLSDATQLQAAIESSSVNQDTITSRTIYDTAGRAKYMINAEGYLTENVYDTNGTIIESRKYSHKFNIDTNLDEASINQLLNHNITETFNSIPTTNFVTDHVNNTTYANGIRHENGQMVFASEYSETAYWPNIYTRDGFDISGPTITKFDVEITDRAQSHYFFAGINDLGAEGSLDRYHVYFRGGKIYAYVTDNGVHETIELGYSKANTKYQVEIESEGDKVRLFVFEKGASRAEGYSHEHTINPEDWGSDVRFRAYANVNTSGTGNVIYMDNFSQGSNAVYSSTKTIVDSTGRGVYSVDAKGHLTESIYDKVGNLVESRRYEDSFNIDASSSVSSVKALTVGKSYRSEKFIYDSLGRVIYNVDANGYVIENQYDSAGRVTDVYEYATAYNGSDFSAANLENLYDKSNLSANDRHTHTSYDSAGNVLSVTDALNYTESYTYNSYGQTTSFTNKKGDTWNYTYDKNGNLTQEFAPEETFYYYDSNGNLQSKSLRLTTHMEYDFAGNVISRTEAYGESFARTTRYGYDKLGRQTYTEHPEVKGETISINTWYDAQGNAVVNKDVLGNYSYKAYDDLGRERFSVDAEGYVTEYQYDAFGNQISLTRYANRLTNFTAQGSTPYSESELEQSVQLIASAQDRTLAHFYDKNNRLIKTEEAQAVVYDVGSDSTYSFTPTVKYSYNAFGDLIETSKLIKASQSSEGEVWAKDISYYDNLGRQIKSIDAEGFVTEYTYDAFDQVVSQLEIANSVYETEPADMGPDRLVTFEYDKLGQLRKQHRENVVYHNYNLQELAPQRVTSETLYDAVGNAIKQIQSGITVSETFYNKLGSKVAVKGAATQVLGNTNVGSGINANYLSTSGAASNSAPAFNTTSKSAYSTFKVDAFGNVLEARDSATGYLNAVPSESSNDRVSRYVYDTHGRVMSEFDAEGHETRYVYDKAGNILTTEKDYKDSSNASSFVARTHYEYDKNGQQIVTEIELGSANQLSHAATGNQVIAVVYNAFGEIIAKGDHKQGSQSESDYISSLQEQFIYDVAGRLVEEKNIDYAFNKDAGEVQASDYVTVKSYQYNEQGLVAKELNRSSGEVIHHYDNLGREIKTEYQAITQTFEDSANPTTLTPSTVKELDRWGNVLTFTDMRGQVSYMRYNQSNQVISQQAPTVKVEGNNTRPVTLFGYDKFGRQIFETDARGNSRFKYYNNLGLLTRETNALGYKTHYAYDILGREVAKQSANGYVQTRSFDKLDQVLLVGDIRKDSNNVWVNQKLSQFSYNALGNKVQTKQALSLNADGSTNWGASYIDYDVRGNTIFEKNAVGNFKYHKYDSQGNRIETSNNLSYNNSLSRDRLNWTYDYFGRIHHYNDLADRDYTYIYNDKGHMTYRGYTDTVTVGIPVGDDGDYTEKFYLRTVENQVGINYTYYDDGKIKTVDDYHTNRHAKYEYDEQGQRTYEHVYGSTTVGTESVAYEQKTTTEYDAHGRMKRIIVEDVTKSEVTLDARYFYDEVGNRTKVLVADSYSSDDIVVYNYAPTVNKTIDPVTLEELNSKTINIGSDLFTDLDIGDTLDYEARLEYGYYENGVYQSQATADLPPEWMSFNAETLKLTINKPPKGASQYTASGEGAGVYRVLISATDDAGAMAATHFTVSVTPYQNKRPTVNAGISTIAVDEQSTFSKAINADAFHDIEGDVLNYQAYLLVEEERVISGGGEPGVEDRTITVLVTEALPSWLQFSSSGVFTGTAPYLPDHEDKTYALRVFAKEANTTEQYQTYTDFNFVVKGINVAPTVDAGLGGEKYAEIGSAFSYAIPSNAFEDGNGDSLTYTVTGMPSWMTYNSTNHTFGGTPPLGSDGLYTVTVKAEDSEGLFATTSFKVRVNSTPTASGSLNNRSYEAERSLSFNVRGPFADADGQSLTYEAKYWNGSSYVNLPSWLNFNVSNGVFSATPPSSAVANYTIRIRATDGIRFSAAKTFNLNITPFVNKAPVLIGSVSNKTVNEGSSFSYTVPSNLFEDPDGHSISYSIVRVIPGHYEWQQTGTDGEGMPIHENVWIPAYETALPGWLTYNASTRTVSGTRTGITTNETIVLRVKATDVGVSPAETGTVNFNLTVVAANDAPTVNKQPNSNYYAEIGSAFSLDLPQDTFKDVNNDSLTYSVTNKPAWLTFTPSTLKFTGTPSAADAGVYNITLTASDGRGGSVSTLVQVIVDAAPVTTGTISNKSYQATRDFSLNLSGYFDDPNGDTLTFSAKEKKVTTFYEPELNQTFTSTTYVTIPSWMSFNSTTGVLSGTPPTGSVGDTHTLRIYASDGNKSVTLEFNLSVTAFVNQGPYVYSAIPNQSVQETASKSYTFSSNTFKDADGHSLTYSASLSSGASLPSWITFNASTRTFSFNPQYGHKGTHYVRVTANDGHGGTVSDVFAVSVAAGPNRSPYLYSAIPDTSVQETGSKSYTFSSTAFKDPDGNALTYSAKLSNGSSLPSWLTFSASSRTFTMNPNYGHKGTYYVTVTANDPSGLSVTDTFKITVTQGPNRTPTINAGIPNISGQKTLALSYTFPSNAFSDPDGDSLTYIAQYYTPQTMSVVGYDGNGEPIIQTNPAHWTTTLPSWLSFNSGTRTFSGTPGRYDPSNFQMRVIARDPSGAQVIERFDINLSEAPNRAPTVNNPIPNRTAYKNYAWSYTFASNTFTDPDGNPLTYSAKQSNGSALPSWLTFNAGTRTFSGTPSGTGTWYIKVTASDGKGGTVSDTFTLSVTNKPNSAPYVNIALADQSMTQYGSKSWSFGSTSFKDADNDALTYTAKQSNGSSLQSWLTFNSSTRTFTASSVPTYGTFYYTVTANDGKGGTVSDTFKLSVAMYSSGGGGGGPGGGGGGMIQSVGDPTLSETNGKGHGKGGKNKDDGGISLMTTSTYQTTGEPYTDPNNGEPTFDPYDYNFDTTVVGNIKEYTFAYDAENRVSAYQYHKLESSGTDYVQVAGTRSREYLEYDEVGNQVLKISENMYGNIRAQKFSYDLQGHVTAIHNVKSYIDSNGSIKKSDSNIDWLNQAERRAAIDNSSIWDLHLEKKYDLGGRVTVTREYTSNVNWQSLKFPSSDPNAGFNDYDYYQVNLGKQLKQETVNSYRADGNLVDSIIRGLPKGRTQSYFDAVYQSNSGDLMPGSQQMQGALQMAANNFDAEENFMNLNKVVYGGTHDGKALGYDATGKILGYQLIKYRGGEGDTESVSSYKHTYFYSYQAFDSYKETKVEGSSETLSGGSNNFKPGTTLSYYDLHGNRTSVTESYDIDGYEKYQARFFTYNLDNQIIRKDTGEFDSGVFTSTDMIEDDNGAKANNTWQMQQKEHGTTHYYYANGQQLGQIDGYGRIDFADMGFQTMGKDVSTSDTTYTVNSGDNLRSIAQMFYGNSDLWYVIADANGLAGDDDRLVQGQALTIPGKVNNHNTADTFKAYNPGEIVGDTTPGIPYVPPPPKPGCGIVQIIMIVVAVVVTIYTAGAAAGAMGMTATTASGAAASTAGLGATALAGGVSTTLTVGATAGSFAAAAGVAATSMAAAFVGGVVGSVASQLVGKALGAGNSFSMRSAFAGGLTSAASAGMGSWLGGSGEVLAKSADGAIKGVNWGNLGVIAGKAALSYGAAHASNKIAGIRSSFSWSGVAAQAVGSVAGGALSEGVGDYLPDDQLINGTVAGFASGAASHAASRLLNKGGKLNYAQIATDAFANALANTIVASSKVEAEKPTADEESSRSGANFTVPDGYIGYDPDIPTLEDLNLDLDLERKQSEAKDDSNSDTASGGAPRSTEVADINAKLDANEKQTETYRVVRPYGADGPVYYEGDNVSNPLQKANQYRSEAVSYFDEADRILNDAEYADTIYQLAVSGALANGPVAKQLEGDMAWLTSETLATMSREDVLMGVVEDYAKTGYSLEGMARSQEEFDAKILAFVDKVDSIDSQLLLQAGYKDQSYNEMPWYDRSLVNLYKAGEGVVDTVVGFGKFLWSPIDTSTAAYDKTKELIGQSQELYSLASADPRAMAALEKLVGNIPSYIPNADYGGMITGMASGGFGILNKLTGGNTLGKLVSLLKNRGTTSDNRRYESYWEDLGQKPASLNNRSVRAWYLSKEMEIPSLLDTSQSLEYQAKQAFDLRNHLRSGARDLMADQKAADYLRKNEPNLTWDEIVTIKSMKYSGDDIWNSIINSSQKSRESINIQFEFIGERARYD